MQTSLSIAAVERDTGLSKDLLRMWERRYGFPRPERDADGERLYPLDQVERLRLIKRVMDQGYRPGKLMAMPSEQLAALEPRRHRPAQAASGDGSADLANLLEPLRRHDGPSFLAGMRQRLARQGLEVFVRETLAPLVRLVGEAWEDGRLEVFEEHLFTELVKRLMRQAITDLPWSVGPPRVLLTTVPGEEHTLGLLMIESLLALEGAECVPLGPQTPILEIAAAARAHRADVVALSFSVAFPARQIPTLVQELRQVLPPGLTLWIGGAASSKVPDAPGIRATRSLDGALAALAEWRATRQAQDDRGMEGGEN